jgi:glutamate/tyrosine decarboxylase-like PLP-dependent enzyme
VDSDLLRDAAEHALGFLDCVDERHVDATASLDELRAALDVPLREDGVPAPVVLDALAEAADAGLIASAGPRFFGFVIGGAQPIAVAADWLTSAWDQNAGLFAASPAAAVAEEVAARWVLDLLGLPATAGVGLVTGGQMANFTCLAAARHEVLARVGWDVEQDGLQGAPPVDVVVGESAHVTIFAALRMLGFGMRRVRLVRCDSQGRMLPAHLDHMLSESGGPAIVCAQAGEINTGGFDPMAAIADAAAARGAWLHVDGAFGLWAAASPRRAGLLEGFRRADSWATDAHKWLNVPYDSGIAIVSNADAHRAAIGLAAAYLTPAPGSGRDGCMYTPEASRRARGFALYATLRALGRQGVADVVDRCCDNAERMASKLDASPHLRVVNDVVLNQVLVMLDAPADQLDRATAATIEGVRREGTCWIGGTVFRDMPAIRVSISNWSTTADDVDSSAAAIIRAAAAVLDAPVASAPS